jgi:predicted nucleotidyltransferase
MDKSTKKMDKSTKKMDKVTELFFEYPEETFTVREIAKRSSVSKSSVQGYLSSLRKSGIVATQTRANVSSLWFRTKKTHYYIEKLVQSGLIGYLIQKLQPEAIILFGSFRRGDSTKESDIDLFVLTHTPKPLDLAAYEKYLKHKIDLHSHKRLSELHGPLLNNVVNGIKLYGSFEVVQ